MEKKKSYETQEEWEMRSKILNAFCKNRLVSHGYATCAISPTVYNQYAPCGGWCYKEKENKLSKKKNIRENVDDSVLNLTWNIKFPPPESHNALHDQLIAALSAAHGIKNTDEYKLHEENKRRKECKSKGLCYSCGGKLTAIFKKCKSCGKKCNKLLH